ncbi:hypothetical protein [Nocardioides speluncae]|uniref:hypothetical protein n=1 Tax=Nocardioides speluncae TaxID=2670337 RepID=UPI0012B1675E|nr:hypothetical protein [Nocardioides speluncae]
MSFDRPAGRQRGRRGAQPLEQAQEARAAMQEQFYRVDQLQRDIGGTVRQYAAVLADRARRTGVVPGFEALDQRANELIHAYIALLDRFDPLEESVLPALQQATPAFGELSPKLGMLADDFERFLDQYGAELARLGEAKENVMRRIAEASGAVDRAEAAWRAMREKGYEFANADEALARARIAGRRLAGIAEQLTPDKVDEPAQVVEKLAAEALALATDLPQRVATLGTRIPSLSTRIDALGHRAESVHEAMGALRREFSIGNWRDIADREADVHKLLEGAQHRLRELRRLNAGGDHAGALIQLAALEDDLASAGEVIDGPRERLDLLRGIKAQPQKLFEQVRFRLRDARYLVMKGQSVAPQPWAGRIDGAAAELISLESMLKGTHPDYWSLHQRLTALDARVRELIDDYRRG